MREVDPADRPGAEPIRWQRSWFAADLDRAEGLELPNARCAAFTRRSPVKESANEDSALVVVVDERRALLAVADGIGGHAAGEVASRVALESLAAAVAAVVERGGELREAVLDGLEQADRRIRELGLGAGTTVCAATIDGPALRTFHVGDAAALLTGQRGRVRHATVAHSPVGYLQEAGLIDEDEAIHHAERHLVSNAVGLGDMKIEVGPVLDLAARDTLVLASDGLWDNLFVEEVVEAVRVGPVEAGAELLRQRVAARMSGAETGQPAKPDDVVLLVWRATRASRPFGSNH